MLDSLVNVKARLGITTSDYNAFLEQQITLISDVIEAYCRRKFLVDDYVQTFYNSDYPTSSHLELYHYPVTSIDSVEEDTVELDVEDYRLHKSTGRLTKKSGHFFCAEETVVTYEAGYTTCPTPVLAVLDALVGERYTKKTAGVDLNFGANVQRLSIPGAISIDFDYTLTSNERKSAYGTIIGSYANILDDWRSERSVIGSGTLDYIEVV